MALYQIKLEGTLDMQGVSHLLHVLDKNKPNESPLGPTIFRKHFYDCNDESIYAYTIKDLSEKDIELLKNNGFIITFA